VVEFTEVHQRLMQMREVFVLVEEGLDLLPPFHHFPVLLAFMVDAFVFIAE